ncbi:MAG: hypothetical protein RMK18_10465 [Armatimonadota bacterium]|nr:hypothetical protein [Armatimonadota bacterium]MCX7778399.1 hypothetical protein [Armatimonadota bacterium]MDW8026268.1 hypothetical protein [Armatimonadota bacterium]
MNEPIGHDVGTVEGAIGLKSASQLACRWLWSAFKDALKLSAFTLNPWQCAETLRYAADEKPLFASAMMTWLQGISFCIALHIIGDAGGWVPSPIIKRLPNLAFVLLYAIVFYPAYWFVRSAIVNLAAELLGAPPRGISFMCSSACAFSPFLLYLPMALILRFTSPELTSGAAYFWVLFVLITVGYTGLLLYVSVRQTYRLNLPKSLLALLVPGVIAIVLGFISYLAISAWMID